MAGEIISNVTSVSNLESGISFLITLLKLIGGIAGVYLIFWLINFFVNYKRIKVLKDILKNVEEINKKLEK